VLADELGLEPSPELRELERAILQQDPVLRANPVGAAVVAETGVRPGRRRRLFIGASLGLLLAGLGAATAVALSRPTHAVVNLGATSGTTHDNTRDRTGTTSQKQGGGGRTTTSNGKQTTQKTTTTNSHTGSSGAGDHTTTTTLTATRPLGGSSTNGVT